jgi:hypothetical protein
MWNVYDLEIGLHLFLFNKQLFKPPDYTVTEVAEPYSMLDVSYWLRVGANLSPLIKKTNELNLIKN